MKTLAELETDKSIFSIGQALGDGWNLVSKNLGYYILGAIITAVIGIGVGIIPFVGGIVNNLILSPCLMGGAVYVTWRISNGRGWTDFGDMFKGFSFLQPLAISTLIQGAITIALMLLVFFNFLPELMDIFKLSQHADMFSRQEELSNAFLNLMRNSKFMVSLLLLTVALLFIAALWAFKIHFIIIYKMQAWPAMEMSRRIARHNLWQLIGFFIVMGFIIFLSALPCGIGLLFTLPWLIGATYSAFAQITHCDQEDEINKDMFDFMADKKAD
jgi:uncharacterized membrane protein